MGHTVSKDGLKPDPAKLQGIQEMPSPQNKQDVKRFLGMVNYLQRYAPNLSQATAPLRDFLKKKQQPVLLRHPTRAKLQQCRASNIRNSSFDVF